MEVISRERVADIQILRFLGGFNSVTSVVVSQKRSLIVFFLSERGRVKEIPAKRRYISRKLRGGLCVPLNLYFRSLNLLIFAALVSSLLSYFFSFLSPIKLQKHKNKTKKLKTKHIFNTFKLQYQNFFEIQSYRLQKQPLFYIFSRKQYQPNNQNNLIKFHYY